MRTSDPGHPDRGADLPDEYAALKAAFGADLEAAEAAHRGRSRASRVAQMVGAQRSDRAPRLRPRRVLTAAGALALAATVGVLVIGPGGGGRLDVVAEAQAALAPRPGILHVRASVATEIAPGPAADDRRDLRPVQRLRWEQWVAPDAWRVKVISVLNPRVQVLLDEIAFADGAESDYYAERGQLIVTTGLPESIGRKPVVPLADIGRVGLGELRRALGRGDLQDRGETTSDGRTVRLLVGRWRSADGELRTVDYRVDPSTFTPVTVTSTLRPDGDAIKWRWRVDYEVYEQLPRGAANDRLLRITPRPGTKVIERTAAEAGAAGLGTKPSER